MKKIVLIFGIIIFPILLIAKDGKNGENPIKEETKLEIKVGSKITLPEGSLISGNFFSDETNTYVIRDYNEVSWSGNQVKREFFIEAFTQNLDHIGSTKINLPEEDLKGEFKTVKTEFLEGRFYMLAVVFNEETSTFDSKIYSFNKDGSLQKSITAGTLELLDWENIEKNFQFQPIQENGRTYLFYSQITKPVEAEKQNLEFSLYNERLVKQWDKNIEFPYDYLEYYISNIKLTEKDRLFFVTRTEPKYILMDPDYKFVFYSQDNDDLRSYKFRLDGKIVKDMKLQKADNNDNYYVFGYYQNSGSDNEYDGLFYFVFDGKTNKVINKSVKDFTPDIIAKIKTKGVIDPYKKLEDLELKKIHFTTQNDVIFISEIERKDVLTFMSDQGGSVTKKDLYHSEDIIVVSFDNEGKYRWSQVVNKDQEMLSDKSLTGHYSFLHNDRLFFMYNDNPKNVKTKEAKKIKTVKARFTTCVAQLDLSNKGEFTKFLTPELGNKKGNQIFRPSHCTNCKNGGFLFVGDNLNFSLSQLALYR